MRTLPHLHCLILSGILLHSSLSAQTPAPPSPPATAVPSTAASPTPLSTSEIQQQLDLVTADTSLSDILRQALTDRYQTALAATQRATSFRSLEQQYRQALVAGFDEAARITAETQALAQNNSTAGPKLPPSADLSNALATEQSQVASLQADLEKNEAELFAFRTRPDEIQSRLAQLRVDLAANATEAARLPNPLGTSGEKATAVRLSAERDALRAETAALTQESLSIDVRRSIAEATNAQLRQKIVLAEQRIDALRRLAADRTSDRLTQATAAVDRVDLNAQPELKPLVASISALVDENRKISGDLEQTTRDYLDRKKQRQRLDDARNDLMGQFQLGGDATSLSPLILEQLRRLPTHWEGRQRLAEIHQRMSQARTGHFQIDQALRGTGPQLATQISSQEKALLDLQQSLREGLKDSYTQWIRSLNDSAAIEQSITEDSTAFRSFAEEKLFWVRSAPVISATSFQRLPEALHYCFGPHRIGELASRLTSLNPAFLLFLIGTTLISLLAARWAARRLETISHKTRHYSSDRFRLTLAALLLTALLALPAPLFLLLIGSALGFQSDASEWSTGLAIALIANAYLLYHLLFMIHACGKHGLGIQHFHWQSPMLQRVRRSLLWAIPVYSFSAITLILVRTEPSVSYLGDLGRLALLFFVLCTGGLLASLLHPEKGIGATIHHLAPTSWFGRLRFVWYWAVIAVVILFTLLLLAGYVFTVLLLIETIDTSASVSALAILVYGLLMRAFSLRERKLARDEMVKKLRARRKEARKAQDPRTSETKQEELSADDLEIEKEIDLLQVKTQTQKFVGFVVGTAFIVLLYLLWMDFGPIVDALKNVTTIGGINPVSAALALLTIAIVTSTVRNLPGILEILFFSHTQIDPGTRNAVVTLAKYAVITFGALSLFRSLGVDWSQFGWIAAALSVGIGFGLQEVVANFISGIILLFERPIRVGDVVTVDGVDGVVSRIQIRATTITNWDRKEFIVPNKQFITGTLMNWTRANSINRITLPVGVAYGSDTTLAMKILLDIANSHPLLLSDPAPFATFEEFGDSALKLVLRCYLPDMDSRLSTITDLHSEIDRRFREADIQIAFPQMDVHLNVTRPIPTSPSPALP